VSSVNDIEHASAFAVARNAEPASYTSTGIIAPSSLHHDEAGEEIVAERQPNGNAPSRHSIPQSGATSYSHQLSSFDGHDGNGISSRLRQQRHCTMQRFLKAVAISVSLYLKLTLQPVCIDGKECGYGVYNNTGIYSEQSFWLGAKIGGESVIDPSHCQFDFPI